MNLLQKRALLATSRSVYTGSARNLQSYPADYVGKPSLDRIHYIIQPWKTIPKNQQFGYSTDARSNNATTEDGNVGDIICSVTPATAEKKGTIATITLSNARRLNSLNRTLLSKLITTLRTLALQSDLRCVVVKGALSSTKTPAFTSGANIYEMASLKSYDEAKAFISHLHEACKALRDLPVVTVAQIHGLCLGGGLELAAACDFRYATRVSTFSMPETKYGIPSVIEARLLANIIGWQKTKEMVYFAKFYTTEEMERWGLVDASYDNPGKLEKKVDEVVKIVTSYGQETMRAQKRLVKFWEENDLVSGIEEGVDVYASMFKDGGSEPAEYMKAFTDRKR
ncbi:ClpP/crotonase-like domain-containing protein [Xylogone sp. PMI_703]|nr:ClpP/crotonase-like domain-containing protein [Xylogone sp. PMI_703]